MPLTDIGMNPHSKGLLFLLSLLIATNLVRNAVASRALVSRRGAPTSIINFLIALFLSNWKLVVLFILVSYTPHQ